MTIPLPEGPAPLPPCAWCGAKGASLLEIEKARYTTAANGTRVVKRKALTVPVCAGHARSLTPNDP